MNELNFQSSVHQEFRFLVDRWGFAEIDSEPKKVRFTSNDIAVEVNYSERNEVDVIIEELASSHRFQFRLFLKLYYPATEKELGYGIAYTKDEVWRELSRLSDALQQYGTPVLEHDEQIFERMRTIRWWELPS